LADNVPLNLSDSKLEENLEIKIRSKPNINLYLTEVNKTMVDANKSSVFYLAEQKSSESTNIFRLQKERANVMNNPFNLKN
jgi:hypothetical protein